MEAETRLVLLRSEPRRVWQYGQWKIFELSSGHFEAVRLQPTKYFIATSLDAAMGKVRRSENGAYERMQALRKQRS